MTATMTISGTIDEIIEMAAILKIGREVFRDASPPDPSKLTLKEADLVRSGNYVMAIKEVRYRTGLGLREAKDLVDASPERRDHPTPINPIPPPQAAAVPKIVLKGPAWDNYGWLDDGLSGQSSDQSVGG